MAHILFLGFSFCVLLGALGVACFKSAVHAVLSLVFAFLNAAALYIMLKADFIALSTIIIYVGAVSVLLLFIVMTLTHSNTLNGFYKYRYWIIGLAFVFAAELITLSLFAPDPVPVIVHQLKIAGSRVEYLNGTQSGIYSLGVALYSKYMFLFILLAVLLFVAMVGAVIIVFQNRSSKFVRRQNASNQINRDSNKVVSLVEVEKGEGI